MMNKRKIADLKKPMSDMKMKFPASFQKEFKKVLKGYLEMKDAFVASDAAQVAAFARVTSKSFKAIAMESLGKMEQSHSKKSIEMLDAIGSDDDLENQRAHYVMLNENIVPIAMNINGVEELLYVQKCPMANNNQGAVWLSTEKDIQNPYYGDTMLTCGSVIEEIK